MTSLVFDYFVCSFFFFFKQKTAYELRISDWSSDVCSSDLSYDMLGEAATTSDDAQRYYADYKQAIHAIGRAAAGRGPYAGPAISSSIVANSSFADGTGASSRSAERRVGKECVSTCSSRRSPFH